MWQTEEPTGQDETQRLMKKMRRRRRKKV